MLWVLGMVMAYYTVGHGMVQSKYIHTCTTTLHGMNMNAMVVEMANKICPGTEVKLFDNRIIEISMF